MKKPLLAFAAAILALPLTASPLLAAQPASVHYADLDLSTPAGKSELDKRIGRAATPVCRDSIVTGTLLSDAFCQSQVRKFVRDEIAQREARTSKGG